MVQNTEKQNDLYKNKYDDIYKRLLNGSIIKNFLDERYEKIKDLSEVSMEIYHQHDGKSVIDTVVLSGPNKEKLRMSVRYYGNKKDDDNPERFAEKILDFYDVKKRVDSFINRHTRDLIGDTKINENTYFLREKLKTKFRTKNSNEDLSKMIENHPVHEVTIKLSEKIHEFLKNQKTANTVREEAQKANFNNARDNASKLIKFGELAGMSLEDMTSLLREEFVKMMQKE